MKEVVTKSQSSVVDTVWYDEEKRELCVFFNTSPDAYSYADVPESVFRALETAVDSKSSVGKWFNEQVKGKFKFAVEG